MKKVRPLCGLTAIAFALATSTAQSTPISDKERKEFSVGFVPSCLVSNKNNVYFDYLNESQKEEYCYCLSNRFSDRMSAEDFAKADKTGNWDLIRPVMNEAGSFCHKTLLDRWVPGIPTAPTTR